MSDVYAVFWWYFCKHGIRIETDQRYECNRDRVPDAGRFLLMCSSKQKRGVFFPKKRRAFVLGLDWDCVLTDGCIVANCKPIRKLPRGMLFCKRIACFHIPAWGFEHK